MPRVVIYTKDYCPFCNYAKALLRSKEMVFQEIDVTSDDLQQEEMIRLSGRRTVPQIFIDDTPIGGFEELRQLENEGKLDRVLGRNS